MRVVVPLCLLLILAGCSGVVIDKFQGFPDKNGSSKILKTAVNTAPYTNDRCKRQYEYNGAFCFEEGNSKTKIAILGDSHAFHLVQGLRDNRVHFVALAQHGTPPIPGFVKENQEKWDGKSKPNMTLAFEKVIKDPSIKTVILAAGWDFLRIIDYKFHNQPFYKTKEERYIKELEKGIESLLTAGKRVIVFRDTPEMRIRPSDCINTRLFFNRTVGSCAVRKDEIVKRAKYGDKIIDLVKAKFGDRISVYSPIDVLCPKNECPMKDNNGFLYRDKDHLSNTGSNKVIKDFLNKYPMLKTMD